MDIVIHQALATVRVTADEVAACLSPSTYSDEVLRDLAAAELDAGTATLEADPELHDEVDGKLYLSCQVMVVVERPPTHLSEGDLIDLLDSAIADAGFRHSLCDQTKRVVMVDTNEHDTTYQVVASTDLLRGRSTPLAEPTRSPAAAEATA